MFKRELPFDTQDGETHIKYEYILNQVFML